MDLAGKPDRDLEDDDTTLEEAFGNLGNPVVSTSKIDEFLAANTKDGRFICVVTSGGTQIALEQRAVRTLENFSTGLRGAIITETLLNSKQSSQYAVVLLVRKGAVLPFARHFSVKEFSDALAYSETTDGIQLGSVKAKESCKRLHEAHAKRRLLVVEYTTVQEYLFTLREVAKTSSPYGKRIMFCLAAAVSDFYIPPNELSSHKLETAGGTLTLRLHKVPKCLGLLRLRWAPSAFIVAFKVSPQLQMFWLIATGYLTTLST